MTVTLTGYGGVGEIGGNAFLLDDGKSRIFLDLGKRFGSDPKPFDVRPPGWNDYFDDFLQPRQFNMAPDLMRLGIIPDLPSLYREDRGGTAGAAPVDAVLISHAHMDHCGLIGLMRPDVPILASGPSQATLASLQTTGAGGALSEYIDAAPKGIAWTKGGKPGKGSISYDSDGEPLRAPRQYDLATKQEIGDWSVRHYDVDHSIHGARGSVLEGPEGSIAYTGDFRMHGREADATKRFLERAGGVDILVTEGTRVSRSQDHAHHDTDDEVAVEGEIQNALDGAGDAFAAVSFPPRDLDRLLSVWHVARSTGRRLVIPTKLAHLIDQLRAAGRDDLPDPRRDAHIAIHVPLRGKAVAAMPAGTLRIPGKGLRMEDVAVDDETFAGFLAGDYGKWEQPYILCDNTVTSADVAAQPHAYLFSISFWTITELFDIFPADGVGRAEDQGLYVHSMTQPFNDEMLISDRKLQRWLDAFRLERKTTHVSGHLSETDLHHVIDEIGADKIVPVHSEAPDLTKQKYEARTGHKALIAHPHQALDLF